MKRLCIVPYMEGVGGITSFRLRMEAGLQRRGISVGYDPDEAGIDALLVIAGTRNLGGVWRARRRGVPVIHRLDGINWIHRRRFNGLRYHLRSEIANGLLATIRRRLVDRVIYQSQFVRGWWERWYGPAGVPSAVILNGVDLQQYAPAATPPPADRIRLVVVEGSLEKGQAVGLGWAIQLARELAHSQTRPVELHVAARVDPLLQARWREQAGLQVHFLGVVPSSEIVALHRTAHLYFSAEVNPPCPNSVIEALACGLPVIGFDSGSLSELVTPSAGRVVPYGGDPWRLDPPDMPALVQAAQQVLADQPRYRAGARARAESALGVERMLDEYLQVLSGAGG